MGSGLCSYCLKGKQDTEGPLEERKEAVEELEETVRVERVGMWARLSITQELMLRSKEPAAVRALAVPSPVASTLSSKPKSLSASRKSSPLNSSVHSLLQEHLTCDSHSEVDLVYSAPLKKYHPGFSLHFQPRFAQLTRSLFQVYKTQAAAEVFASLPLDSIPLALICHIREFEFQVFVPHSSPQLRFFFEIYIVGESGEVEISRRAMVTREELGKAVKGVCVKEVGRTVERGRLVKKPVRTCEDYGESRRVVSEASWSYREVDWYASEKRLLFTADSQREVQLWTEALILLCTHIRSQ